MSNDTLRTSALSIGYRKKTLIADINIELRPGDVCAMLGANGAGKSTLLKTLTGEIPPTAGEVFLLGQPLASYSPRKLARTVALVTTGATHAGALSVRRLVALGRQPYTGLLGRLSRLDIDIADQAMRRAGIAHKADSFVADLSDGERQKALIARALAQDTPIILLDEPFSFLDVASRVEILAVLKSVAAEKGTSVLFSSHDVAQALRMADSLLLFTAGGSVVQGSPQTLTDAGLVPGMFEGRNVVFDPLRDDFVAPQDNNCNLLKH